MFRVLHFYSAIRTDLTLNLKRCVFFFFTVLWIPKFTIPCELSQSAAQYPHAQPSALPSDPPTSTPVSGHL